MEPGGLKYGQIGLFSERGSEKEQTQFRRVSAGAQGNNGGVNPRQLSKGRKKCTKTPTRCAGPERSER